MLNNLHVHVNVLEEKVFNYLTLVDFQKMKVWKFGICFRTFVFLAEDEKVVEDEDDGEPPWEPT